MINRVALSSAVQSTRLLDDLRLDWESDSRRFACFDFHASIAARSEAAGVSKDGLILALYFDEIICRAAIDLDEEVTVGCSDLFLEREVKLFVCCCVRAGQVADLDGILAVQDLLEPHLIQERFEGQTFFDDFECLKGPRDGLTLIEANWDLFVERPVVILLKFEHLDDCLQDMLLTFVQLFLVLNIHV